MPVERAELVFIVQLDRGGWVVTGPMVMGPFPSREHALDLADGMAQAIRSSGHRARVETK